MDMNHTNSLLIQNSVNERMATILASIGDRIISTDIKNRIIFMNDSAEEFTGWKAEEAQGKNFYEIMPIMYEEKKESLRNPMKIALENEDIVGVNHHLIYVFQNGKKRFISANFFLTKDSNMNIIGAVIAFRDTTNKKVAKDVLERYQIISEKARDIIMFIDMDGKIIDANEAAVKAYGYNREELLSITIYDLRKIGGLTKEQMYKADNEGIVFEIEHFRKDGSSFPVEVSSQGATIEGKRVLVSIIRDISERKKAESKLKRGKEAAEAANIAKSEFLANMSHEIRTPLNGMLGMIDLTLMSDLNYEQKQNLDIAKSCASSLLKVINDILDFSKIEAGKLVIENIGFNIKELIEDIVKVHSIHAEEKGLELFYQYSTMLPQFLKGDPGRLKQILNNLIGNAIKFTQKGSVSVSVKKQSQIEDEIEVLFCVSDTGVGIAQDELGLLFKSFSQVDSSYTKKFAGTGLGLAISKQLVEIMGGNVWIESEKGIGSKFNFTVKLMVGNKSETKVDIIPIAGKELGREFNILLVDDDTVNQRIIERTLEERGHNVTIANNGREGFEVYQSKVFDIILMDIQMPEMDGIQATAAIRKKEEEKGGYTPIIALTAYALKGDKEKFLSLGVDGYISKPIEINELLTLISKLTTEEKATESSIFDTIIDDILVTKEKINIDDEIISQTLDDISLQILLLNAVLNDSNMVAVERIAHLIKNLSLVINAHSIKNMAFRIELAVRRGNLDEAKDIAKELEADFSNFKKLIN